MYVQQCSSSPILNIFNLFKGVILIEKKQVSSLLGKNIHTSPINVFNQRNCMQNFDEMFLLLWCQIVHSLLSLHKESGNRNEVSQCRGATVGGCCRNACTASRDAPHPFLWEYRLNLY